MDHWKALNLWSPHYLMESMGKDHRVTVALTPDGLADSVQDIAANEVDGSAVRGFCLPHEEAMTLGDFFKLFWTSKEVVDGVVPYLQRQNSSMTAELEPLLEDIDRRIPWFEQALGLESANLEAINFWLGDHRSTTSFHKDHYENLYGVVKGEKIFHLLPPTDAYRLALRAYPTAKWTLKEGVAMRSPVLRAELLDDGKSRILWSPVHPSPIDERSPSAAIPMEELHNDYPHFFDPTLPPPLVARVRKGDMLFLPSMWYHYVEQREVEASGCVMAVNYWYDMSFDRSYALWSFCSQLAEKAGLMDTL